MLVVVSFYDIDKVVVCKAQRLPNYWYEFIDIRSGNFIFCCEENSEMWHRINRDGYQYTYSYAFGILKEAKNLVPLEIRELLG